MSDEGHLWVLAHRLVDPPAVLQAAAPLGALCNRHGGGTAADLFRRVLQAGGTEDALQYAQKLVVGSAEWLVDPRRHHTTRLPPCSCAGGP
ncbi:hypothetical protein ACT18_02565 [Mycolicibacter kumamotonensis]|uniref:Uncharacterized protein n=1 Tax=Mycolicibacter kumamotonensis TaxID=354243 RepID=A0A1B8SKE8_9MYCO|nr:hypothetical protein ACT18_02565 [Mycolicibacter kumamotonensis]